MFKPIEFNSEVGFGKEPKPAIFYPIEYTIETIYEKINNIDNLNEEEMKNIILRQYAMILNYDLFLSSEKSRILAQKLFTNVKFLNILRDIIGILQLNDDQAICLNKIVYDYYVSNNNDQVVANLLLEISNILNFDLSQKLSRILGYNGARILAMISRSTFKQDKKVHRINTFICRCDMNLTVDSIVSIYTTIFERFTELFISSMIEVMSDSILNYDNYLNISNSLILLLHQFTSLEIEQILTNYAVRLQYIKNIKDDNGNYLVRFSFKDNKKAIFIPDRIRYITEKIEFEKGLIIP